MLTSQQIYLRIFWLAAKILIVLIVLAFILAAVLPHLSLDGLQTINSIFQIIP